MKAHSNFRGFFFAVTAGICWGVSGTFVQFLLHTRGLNIEWLVSVRLLVAGSILLLLAAAKKDTSLTAIWHDRRNATSLLTFSLLGMLAVQYTFFSAIKYTNAATATILQFLGPVIIAGYLAIRQRRMPDLRQLLAIGLAVAGTFLLVTHGSFDTISISGEGLLWGIASAVTLAFYSLQPAALFKKFNMATIVGYSMVIGGIALSIGSHPWEVPGTWDLPTYLCTAFIFIPGTLVAFYIYLIAIKNIGAQTPSLLVSVEPVSAALLSVFWLGVPFGWTDLLGTAFILATIFLLTKGRE
ncbi:DMT family transporter [Hufsiella ginkgonis]|uniref:EamA family transporter n=1 Tax=Hufsiella ginkgonis TaxID=2695274 RepID=A0A7K1XTG2_9SPHI|nr:DMT family transporter [Hufsiella ginkgonis]MXV13806.1 EamA family transporter [Hufsiella ginkgonis]